MNLRRLIFRERIPFMVEYNNFAKSISDMDEFHEGHIGESEINVFYRSRLLGLPLTKVQLRNSSDENGALIIIVKFVDLIPIIYGLSIFLVCRDSILDAHGRGPLDGLVTSIFVALLFYGFLQYRFYMELLDFRVTLKRIEVQWRSSNARQSSRRALPVDTDGERL
jgi:hypothetical protein